EESVKNLLIATAAESAPTDQGMRPAASATAASPAPSAATVSTPAAAGVSQIPLSQVADVRIVQGPSMIKSENGLLRSYVQLNVRDRDIVGFVEEAQQAVAEQIKMPPGMYVEWSGEFEHQVRAKKTLVVIVPIVVAIIFVLLYITYSDLA